LYPKQGIVEYIPTLAMGPLLSKLRRCPYQNPARSCPSWSTLSYDKWTVKIQESQFYT